MRYSAAAAAASCLALASHVHAVPVSREEVTEQKITDLMTNAIRKFMAGQTIGADGFTAIANTVPMPWLGEHADNTTMYEANNKLFKALDVAAFKDGDEWKPNNFADEYTQFIIHAVGDYTGGSNETSQELKDKTAQWNTACGDMKGNYTTGLADLKAELSALGKEVVDDDLDRQVKQNGTYRLAADECFKAKAAMDSQSNDENGQDFALFSRMNANAEKVKDAPSTQETTPYVTMPLSGSDGPLPADSAGNNVALYSLAGINGTVDGWVKSPSTFTYDTSQETESSSSESLEWHAGGSGIFRVLSGGADVSHSETKEQSSKTTQGFHVSFKGIGLIDIDYGLWYDNFAVAEKCQQGKDDHSAKCKATFDKFFGSGKDKEGSAARRNAKALVTYGTSWSMKFADETHTHDFSETKIDASLGFGLFGSLNGGSKSVKDVTGVTINGNEVKYEDPTPFPTIIGFTTDSAWETESKRIPIDS